ncbi:hypothetical protein BTR14_13175 [Rhizobium rhizosphaerae]|uniref:Uncharacterized protein n=1 Tax=Xaviernesmea rhizosphaerae TaxID=1672749 RepID=A0ABX3PD42_9HYPH|nr:hypothetical protein [Xaviernesmea rhizosphaerae]OQP86029.1 hypothetical protein BTR14_13175 [Xaviernesmea rhizosphaerae]
MTVPEHSQSAAVEQAAIWLADLREPPHPVVPALKERFGLSAVEACEAIALADRMRIYRKAHG